MNIEGGRSTRQDAAWTLDAWCLALHLGPYYWRPLYFEFNTFEHSYFKTSPVVKIKLHCFLYFQFFCNCNFNKRCLSAYDQIFHYIQIKLFAQLQLKLMKNNKDKTENSYTNSGSKISF